MKLTPLGKVIVIVCLLVAAFLSPRSITAPSGIIGGRSATSAVELWRNLVRIASRDRSTSSST